MERRIADRFHDDVLREAMRRYGIAPAEVRPLAAAENLVYAFGRGPDRFVLRFGHDLRRSEVMIEAEVAWIEYLAAGGISVARAVRSRAGNVVEAIDDGRGGRFLTTAFEGARGRPLGDAWTPDLYAAFGHCLGSMHALAAPYRPARPDLRRPAWDDVAIDPVERFLPASDLARDRYRAACAEVRSLPTDPSGYGLIHFDAHGGNGTVDDEGRITLFDFDDCCYSWYVNDLAIATVHATLGAHDVAASAREFVPHLLRGYRSAYALDSAWLPRLPLFLKLAEIFTYAVIHRDFDVHAIADPACATFMRGRKERIENDVPYLDLDLESLTMPL